MSNKRSMDSAIWAACYGASFARRAHDVAETQGRGWSEVFRKQEALAEEAACLADEAVIAYYQYKERE